MKLVTSQGTRELVNYMRVTPDKTACELEGGGHAFATFLLHLEKKMLERNSLGKKEFTLTPSLNMICLVRAGTAAGAGHVACMWGGCREMAAHAQLALFLFSWTPQPMEGYFPSLWCVYPPPSQTWTGLSPVP